MCHSLPGRLRLTATGLRFLPDNGRALAEALARFGGMRRVRVNTVVESVLLEYDPERLDAQAAQEHAEMVLARFAMDAMRARHGASTNEDAEASMSTRQLAQRLAVNAGADLLLIGNNLAYEEDAPDKAINALMELVAEGTVSPARIRESAERIAALKSKIQAQGQR